MTTRKTIKEQRRLLLPKKLPKKRSLLAPIVSATLLATSGVAIATDQTTEQANTNKASEEVAQAWSDTQTAFQQGWLEGKVETAIILNEHLNPFNIDVSVRNDTAHLNGKVTSEVAQELAATVAKGIDGIKYVENNITVQDNIERIDNQARKEARQFSQFINDATLTASIKMDLLASDSINALDINIDSDGSTVTLNGTVHSAAEKDLVEELTKLNKKVATVVNNLRVVDQVQ